MDTLFDRVMTFIVVPLTVVLGVGALLFIAVGPIWFVFSTANRPYTQGETVVIKAIGLPAVVQTKDPSFVEVSYVDDFGRMAQAKLLYSEVAPLKGEGNGK